MADVKVLLEDLHDWAANPHPTFEIQARVEEVLAAAGGKVVHPVAYGPGDAKETEDAIKATEANEARVAKELETKRPDRRQGSELVENPGNDDDKATSKAAATK